MASFMSLGLLLGLSAGISPGPLLALVISETLKHDMKAGVKVAFAPVITDMPIIILTVFILSKLSQFSYILGGISFIGGFLLLYMGFENLRTRGAEIEVSDSTPKSLIKGIAANAISPHPYLFWLSVGAPMTMKALDQSVMAALAFLCGFYFLLVGSKIALAVLVGRYKSFLSDDAFIYTTRALGLLLLVFAVFLFYDGLKIIGWA